MSEKEEGNKRPFFPSSRVAIHHVIAGHNEEKGQSVGRKEDESESMSITRCPPLQPLSLFSSLTGAM